MNVYQMNDDYVPQIATDMADVFEANEDDGYVPAEALDELSEMFLGVPIELRGVVYQEFKDLLRQRGFTDELIFATVH